MALDQEFREEKVADEGSGSNSSAGLPSAVKDIEQGSSLPMPQQQPLASELPRKKRSTHPIQTYLGADISTDRVDVLMLVCCLSSGFIDSTIYYGQYQAQKV